MIDKLISASMSCTTVLAVVQLAAQVSQFAQSMAHKYASLLQGVAQWAY